MARGRADGWRGAPRVSDVQLNRSVQAIDIEVHDSRLIKSMYSDGLVTSRDNTVKSAAAAELGCAEGEHRRRAATEHAAL
jgi:hypothetical protein